jgi:hypothetical protein
MDEDRFSELVKFLYPSLFNSDNQDPQNLEGSQNQGKSEKIRAIQIVFADKNTKQAVVWYPGKRAKQFNWDKIEKDIIKDKYLIGFTGKTYRDYEKSMWEQTYAQHWIGIDIDDLPLNADGLVDKSIISKILYEIEFGTKDSTFATMVNQEPSEWLIEQNKDAQEKINNTIHGYNIISQIRYSTSGKGLHLIFRLKSPETFEPGTRNSLIIKKTLQPIVDKLESAGVPVCCYSGNVFYVLGGKQEAIFTNEDAFINLHKDTLTVERNMVKMTRSVLDIENLNRKNNCLNEYGQEFFDLLPKYYQNNIDTLVAGNSVDCWVKEIFEALGVSKFKFTTKSPMISDHFHVNGFLKKDGLNLQLWSMADKKFVFSFEAFELDSNNLWDGPVGESEPAYIIKEYEGGYNPIKIKIKE